MLRDRQLEEMDIADDYWSSCSTHQQAILSGYSKCQTQYIPFTGNQSSEVNLRINNGNNNVSRIRLNFDVFCVYDFHEQMIGDGASLNMNNNSNDSDSSNCDGQVQSSRSMTSIPPKTYNQYLLSSRLLGVRSRNSCDIHGLFYRSRNTRRDRHYSKTFLFDARTPELSILSRAERLTEIFLQMKQHQLGTLGMEGQSTEGTAENKAVSLKKRKTSPSIQTESLEVKNTGSHSDLEISGAAVQTIESFQSGLDLTDCSVQTNHSFRSGLDVTDSSVQTNNSFQSGQDVTDSSVQTNHSFRSGLDVTDSSVQTNHSFQSGQDVTDSSVQTNHSFRSGLDVTESSAQTIHSFKSGQDVTDSSVQTNHSFRSGLDVTESSAQTIQSFRSGLDVTDSSENIPHSFQSDMQQLLDAIPNKQVPELPQTLKDHLVQRICFLLIHGKKSSGNILDRSLINSLKHNNSRTSLPNSASFNKKEPFTSEFVFKKVFGPDVRVAKHYWHVQPPVLPPPCVKYKSKSGVLSSNIIGRGTFAEITVATLHVDGQSRHVVLKEHYIDMVSKDDVFREAKLTMYLEPTGCVPVCYGLVKDGIGGHSVVLELIGSGTTLGDVVGKVTLPLLHWLSIARQLAEGLCKIHEMDILINDVKPDNVLVDLTKPAPVLKYCDFGHGSYKYGIVFTDQDMEQFVHLAPEVRAGGQTSRANDVYGLGRLLGRIVDVSGISAIVPLCQRCKNENPDRRISAAEASAWLKSFHKEQVADTTASYSDPHISSGYGSSPSSSYASLSVCSTSGDWWDSNDTWLGVNVSGANVLILLILLITMALHPWVIGPCCYSKC
ncbi:uncharacterized protein LOC124138254 isoform X2 [Haliotis rufescens]|uniref:uncharacterized protein LOC124138254 isoform X2 n=1 Tax=Haliotis rufescens TaxID=6454 RepID=UPI00201EC6DD|nr:uncharacterized protein LOC124138254 isoform X2 [Haliotis rufescens]